MWYLVTSLRKWNRRHSPSAVIPTVLGSGSIHASACGDGGVTVAAAPFRYLVMKKWVRAVASSSPLPSEEVSSASYRVMSRV